MAVKLDSEQTGVGGCRRAAQPIWCLPTCTEVRSCADCLTMCAHILRPNLFGGVQPPARRADSISTNDQQVHPASTGGLRAAGRRSNMPSWPWTYKVTTQVSKSHHPSVELATARNLGTESGTSGQAVTHDEVWSPRIQVCNIGVGRSSDESQQVTFTRGPTVERPYSDRWVQQTIVTS